MIETETPQLNFFDALEMYACDRCNVEAAADRPGALPSGWKLVGKGIACTRSRARGWRCEPFELHYCADCVAKTT